MKSSAKNIKLKSIDDLFSTDESREIDSQERVQEIEISRLISYKDHPFKVLEDDKMTETMESIQKNGVLIPIIARETENDQLEIISGHRRTKACQLLGLDKIPCIIRDLDDEESTIIMVDSNIQRENLLHSEKAFAYKMKLDAIKNQGKRTDLTCVQVGHKLKSRDILAQNSNDSGVQISRYIRLTELIQPLLDMVDEKLLAFNVGVDLSYLSADEQTLLIEVMKEFNVIPSIAQAKQLKDCTSENNLTKLNIELILSKKATKNKSVTFTKSKLNEFFPRAYTNEQIEDVIFSLLTNWKEHELNNKNN
ncbi:MAG: ParB/RepB/Spo0J family partition protein [Clostridia bacterium]